jgi:GMP synthase (glutamine-hydrolysing)
VKPLLIIKTGRTLRQVPAARGDFERWIAECMALDLGDCHTAEVSAGEALPDPHKVSGVVITGSAAMVSDRLPWSEATAAWLRDAGAAVPVLGICYGHQLLAHAYGGTVDYHPRGREMGTTWVRQLPQATDDPLFAGIPAQFSVHVTHQQSVLALPPGAQVLASNEFEPHHAIRFRERVWGVQFHPEFDAEVMRAYLDARAPQLEAEGFKLDQMHAAVQETPESRTVLRNFAALLAR